MLAIRYDVRPNGHGKLSISMQRVPAGDYETLVDDAPLVAKVIELSTLDRDVRLTTTSLHDEGARWVFAHRLQQHAGEYQ